MVKIVIYEIKKVFMEVVYMKFLYLSFILLVIGCVDTSSNKQISSTNIKKLNFLNPIRQRGKGLLLLVLVRVGIDKK